LRERKSGLEEDESEGKREEREAQAKASVSLTLNRLCDGAVWLDEDASEEGTTVR
jgi:hypothetical protein